MTMTMTRPAAPQAGQPADETLPLEVLEERLSSWAASIAAAEARWLGWLAEYVRREGFLEWGCRSAAQWLSWKCGMSLTTAREKVRVAAALEGLPLVADAFGAGRLSYSKVRALSRVANESNEADLVAMALSASGAQLEAICSGYRRSHQQESPADAYEQRSLAMRTNPDGTATITWVLPADHAADVMARLTDAVDTQIEAALASPASDSTAVSNGGDQPALSRREIIDDRGGIAAMRSDAAWTAIVEPSPTTRQEVDGGDRGHGAGPSTSPVTVTVIIATQSASAEALSNAQLEVETPNGTVDQRTAPAAVVARRSCDPLITALIDGADSQPLAVGRATRLINRRLRLALERRDNHTCRFPGCDATRHLHAHHIIHWANGGPTVLANLVLLCRHHHHLVHDGGWSITRTAGSHTPGAAEPITFIKPDGTVMNPCPDSTWRFTPFVPAVPTHLGRAVARALEPEHFGPLDLAWTTTVLHHNAHLRQLQPSGVSIRLAR